MDKKPTLKDYYLSRTREQKVGNCVKIPEKKKEEVEECINIDIDDAVDMVIEMMGGIRGQKTLRDLRAVELKELARKEEAEAKEEEEIQSYDFDQAAKIYSRTLAEEAFNLQSEFTTTLSENNQEHSNEQ